MAVSKRTRFDVFKRDGLKCQYCGRTPPAIVLHADHIVASSAGGGDDADNLITSCADCNLGKSNVPLDAAPESVAQKLEVLRERREQLEAYEALLREQTDDQKKSVRRIARHFAKLFPDKRLSERFKNASLKHFLRYFPESELTEFLSLSASRFPYDPERALRYFCGICWKRIKGEAVGH